MKNLNTFLQRSIIKITLLFCLVIPRISHAKPLSAGRKFLNALSFNFSTGFNLTSYRLPTAKVILIEKDGQYYFYNTNDPINIAYLFRSWGAPLIKTQLYEGADFWAKLTNKNKKKSIDMTGIGYGIPITVSMHVDIKQKFRFEIGATLSPQFIRKLVPTADYKETTPVYLDSQGKYYNLQLYVAPGFKVLKTTDYALWLNARISGSFAYQDPIHDASTVMTGLLPIPIGAGIKLEKRLSEYLSVFSSASYDITSIWQTTAPTSKEIYVLPSTQTVSINFGCTLTPTERRTCKIKGCKIKTKHVHGAEGYRGSAWFKGKTPQGNRLYK